MAPLLHNKCYICDVIILNVKKFFRISLIVFLCSGIMFAAFADRGVGKKKSRISLNVRTSGGFSSNLNYNLKTGMRYIGSVMNPANAKALVYQKNNSVYVVPYKQKVVVPDMAKGYSGSKLIIRFR